MAETKPIVVVGSINIDLVAGTARIPVEGETVTGDRFQTHPGGKGANQAVAVARLGHPEPATLVPSFDVKAIDTTAAGDCFNGAFAVGLATGKTAVESARFAAAAAAISVTRPGAQPSMPALPEVERLLETAAEEAVLR